MAGDMALGAKKRIGDWRLRKIKPYLIEVKGPHPKPKIQEAVLYADGEFEWAHRASDIPRDIRDRALRALSVSEYDKRMARRKR